MVWRQLPKLIPAGSIPVSRSKQKKSAVCALFFVKFWKKYFIVKVLLFGRLLYSSARSIRFLSSRILYNGTKDLRI